MRFESHFKSYFGNVKAFNLKKIKIIAEPVAAMARGGPAAGAMAGKFLRQTKGRTVFGKESFESIPETSRSSVETCTWAI